MMVLELTIKRTAIALLSVFFLEPQSHGLFGDCGWHQFVTDHVHSIHFINFESDT